MAEEFQEEPRLDFTDPQNVREMGMAIANVAENLGLRYGHLAADAGLGETPVTFDSVNPGDPAEVVGTLAKGGPADVAAALAAAKEAAPDWYAQPAAQRARVLERAVDALRIRRGEFTAWLCFEAGMPWRDADDEVASAIDSLRRCTRAAVASEAGRDGEPAAAGPGGVFGGYESPLADTAAMLGAAVGAGRTAVFSPDARTAVVGWKLVDVLRDAGLPEHVLQAVFGDEDVQRILAIDAATQFSLGTGWGEYVATMATCPFLWARPVCHRTEFVVDPDADLAPVAELSVRRACRFSGQASERFQTVVVAAAHADELERLCREQLRAQTIGQAVDVGTTVGPLIDGEAVARLVAWFSSVGAEFPDAGEWPGHLVAPAVVRLEARSRARRPAGPVLGIEVSDELDSTPRPLRQKLATWRRQLEPAGFEEAALLADLRRIDPR